MKEPTAKLPERPKLHVFMEAEGQIYISAYDPDGPLWELNHIVMGELRNGGATQINKHESALNILSNVLEQAGIEMVRS